MSHLLGRLKSLLAPPHFGEPETAIRAAILNAITLTVASIVPALLIVIGLLNPGAESHFYFSAAGNVLLAVISNIILRRGKVEAASLFFILAYILKLFVFAALSPGNSVLPIVATMVALFWAGFILERWIVALLTVLVVAAGFGFAYWDTIRSLPVGPAVFDSFDLWLIVVTNIIVLMVTQQVIDLIIKGIYHRLNEEVQARSVAERDLKRLNTIKDDFLMNLSHELRTPLTSIKGYADLLQDNSLDDETRKLAVEAIIRNADLQETLVLDLLDLSAIIKQSITLHKDFIELPNAVRATIATFAPEAKRKDITLVFKCENESQWVYADPKRLQQILSNLLSNAIKFSERGGVVDVSVEQTDSWHEITVRDEGVGISQDYLPHVFERFSQADSSRSRSHGGLGIGLAISKTLVDLHGGFIEVRSEGRGRGASFTIKLPRDEPSLNKSALPFKPRDA